MYDCYEKRAHAFIQILLSAMVQDGFIDADALHVAAKTFESALNRILPQFGYNVVLFRVCGEQKDAKGEMYFMFEDVDEVITGAVADGGLDLDSKGSGLYPVRCDFYSIAQNSGHLCQQEIEAANIAARRFGKRPRIAVR